METSQKVNKEVMLTQWNQKEQFLIDELESYPFMLSDARRLVNERCRLIDKRMERDMPSMVHRYDNDSIQRTGVSDPMFDIVVANEGIDFEIDELTKRYDDILARRARLRLEIDRLPVVQKQVIMARYFDRYSWKKVRELINFGKTQTYRLHDAAIRTLTIHMDDCIEKKMGQNGAKWGIMGLD